MQHTLWRSDAKSSYVVPSLMSLASDQTFIVAMTTSFFFFGGTYLK